MRITKTKIASVLAVTAVVALGGTAAMAYWTTSGSGTGAAGAGDVSDVGVFQTVASPSILNAMYPGASTTLSGDFLNTNPGSVHLTTVTISSIDITPAVGASGSCTAADFDLTGTGTVGNSGAVPASTDGTAHSGSWSGLVFAMKNTASNQDGCKNATLTLHYSAISA
jgi:hypothetical protein